MRGQLPSPPAEQAPVSVDLVTDHPRAMARQRATGRVDVRLPAQARAARDGVLLAMFMVLLYKHSGQDELAVGIAGADEVGRVLRIAVDPGAPFTALVSAVRRSRPVPAEQRSNIWFVAGSAAGGELPRVNLALVVRPAGEVTLLFDEGLFDRSSIERMAEHLRRIGHQVTAQPDRTVAEIDLLTGRERAQILGGFNATARPYPREVTIHQLFTEQAWRGPDRVAVTYGRQRLTYRELDSASDRLATRLVAAGVRAGQPVGLLMPRGVDAAIATLAVLKARGAYLPIDPDYPPQRAGFLLSDSAAGVLVTTPAMPVPPGFTGQVCFVGDDGPAGPADAGPEVGAMTGVGVAYVIYTSGTTGRPKGVRVSHRGVVRLVRNTDYLRFTPDTRVLATCAPVFDVATFELWGPLLNGGSVHLVPGDVILSAAALGRALVEQRITTMWLTSPLFNQLVEQDPTIFGSLRELLVGGDVLSPHHVGKVLDACPGLRMINGYGPTENTTFSTTHPVTMADLGRIPIGRPIANSTAYVVNRDGQLCPVGVPGELCLGGDGVADGYLNRPELTAASFVPDPFTETGRLMYRTGDVARWRPDGVLEFFGRRDHQVKVRGYRIELGEIEHALLSHPAVREAVVVTRPAPTNGDRRLCGYYVTDGAELVTAGQLRAHLGRSLPDHMVPAHLVRLPALPLNQSGKVDRGQLPEPVVEPAGTFAAPRDGTESTLARLAGRVLGVASVGIHDDLRDLGADSLTATLIAAGVATELGVAVPVSRLLRAATIERIARLVRCAETKSAAVPRVSRAPELPDYPATPQQHRLYVEQYKDETAVHYNVPVTVDLPAGTDPDRLLAAFGELTTRHDALRTEFTFQAGELRQRIVPTVPLPVKIVATAPAVERFVRPFDLGRAPLWRAVVHVGTERVRLLLDLHHVITDGVSLAVLLDELGALYHGAPLPPVHHRYRDFAHWSGGIESHRARERDGAYWAGVFATTPARGDLPLDFARAPIRALDGGAVAFDFGRQRTAGLRRLARRHDVTVFAVLAAAYTALLARLTGERDVVVGTPVSGRGIPGFERTVGMFANTVCLRTAVDPELTFADHVHLIAHTAEDAFAHQEYPLQDLVARVAPQRDYRRTPLFDSLIALHSARYLQASFGDRQIPLRMGWNGQAVFDLNLQIYETAQTLLASWQYASRLLRQDTACRWRDALLELTDTALADPDTRLGALTGLAGATRTQVPDLEFDL